jgi:hypothetical protein
MPGPDERGVGMSPEEYICACQTARLPAPLKRTCLRRWVGRVSLACSDTVVVHW